MATPPPGERGFHGNHPPEEEHIPAIKYRPEGGDIPKEEPKESEGFSLGFLGTTAKTAKTFKAFWTSTFQPELFSDRSLEADPLFARYKSRVAHEKDAVIHQSEKEWNYWNKKSIPERMQFLFTWERGGRPADAEQAAMMRRWKAIIDENYQLERAMGSKAGFVRDYLAHIWKKPADFNAWTDAKFGTDQVGPTWFQKGRTFQFIEDGLAAGLELRYTTSLKAPRSVRLV